MTVPAFAEMRDRLARAHLPPMLILDITNVCNLKCIHCPQPAMQADPNFKARHLSWEYFTRIVDEIAAADHECLLRFVGDGEPLLHARLFDMVEYAKAHCRAVLNLTTNGVLLTPPKAERLLAAGVDLVDFSIDALTKPTYETVRVKGDYERLLENIFATLRLIKAKGLRTKVMVSFIAQDENAHEADAFRAFWAPLVDYVMVRQLHSAVGLIKAAESQRYNRAADIERYPCPHLWKRLTVDFTGNIKYCAHDWGHAPEMILGNMADTTLSDVWSGARLRDLRERHVANDFVPGSICERCTDWASSRWDYGYERLIDRVVFQEPRLMPELPPLSAAPPAPSAAGAGFPA